MMAPDVTAQIFWLKNRRPDLWRDASRHEMTGPNGELIPLASPISIYQIPANGRDQVDVQTQG